MSELTATPYLSAELSANGNTAPEWVELLPAGPDIKARDGRHWHYTPEKVIAAFTANKGPLSIDYEHGQDHLAINGQMAPAAGWITEMENRGGALWGKVEWTARAAEMIVAREYRFLSPAIRYLADGEVTRLAGAGLVNRPALEMTALSREETNLNQEHAMSLSEIAKALGLKDTADEKAILAAISLSILAGENKGAVSEPGRRFALRSLEQFSGVTIPDDQFEQWVADGEVIFGEVQIYYDLGDWDPYLSINPNSGNVGGSGGGSVFLDFAPSATSAETSADPASMSNKGQQD